MDERKREGASPQVVEIFERLGSIEAKIDNINSIRDVAYDADKKAEQAVSQASNNMSHITRLENNFKWAVGLIVSIVVPIAVIVFNFMIGK